VAVAAPDRGDLVWLNFTPQAGHEQAGHRPAVVLSPRAYNSRSGLAVVVPVTTRPKGRPFEVALPSGLPIRGVVLADQVRSVDWSARGVEHAGRLPSETEGLVRGTARRLLE
jgi:mRNA interferase MazF